MSDDELEKIRQKKIDMLLKQQLLPNKIINLHEINDLQKLTNDFPDKVIIIDLWAIWCGPCKFFEPIFEKVYKKYSKDFIFAKVNVDENPSIAQYYGVSAIPTTLFIKNGELIRKFVGLMNYDIFIQILEALKSA